VQNPVQSSGVSAARFNDCRHESIYAAPPFPRLYGDESAAISKAASPACRAARMLTSELDAASAAFEVGYESPSQVNREYKRLFGRPQFAI
jgi:hypothetical protein